MIGLRILRGYTHIYTYIHMYVGGSSIGVIKVDTSNLDYSSCGFRIR